MNLEKKSKRKKINSNVRVIKKNKNTINVGAVTKGKYQIQNDQTSVDDFVKEVHEYFGSEILKTSVSGMNSIPSKYKNSRDEHLRLNKNKKNNFYWIKDYYTRFTFNEKACRFNNVIESIGTVENYNDFYKEVIKPINNEVQKYFLKIFPKYQNDVVCSVGFSGMEIRLIIRISLPIRTNDVVTHCGKQYISEYATTQKRICKHM